MTAEISLIKSFFFFFLKRIHKVLFPCMKSNKTADDPFFDHSLQPIALCAWSRSSL